MRDKIPSFLLDTNRTAPPPRRRGSPRLSALGRGIEQFARVVRTSLVQWETASRDGFFQGLDPRVKLLFLAFFVVIISVKKTLSAEIAIGVFVFILAAISRLPLAAHYGRIAVLGFFFGFLVTLPAALNIFTPGEVVVTLVRFAEPRDLWIYHVPQVVGITKEGLTAVVMLTMRVLNSLSVSLLVISTTPFAEVVRALKVLRVPDLFIMTLTLAYKYIFIFAQTAHDMHLAKKARLLGRESEAESRRWVAGRMAFLFRKSQHRCEEVFKAMQERGFSGTIKICRFGAPAARDFIMALLLSAAGVVILLV
jgi:cobalt ECF transporter T component CbiQ